MVTEGELYCNTFGCNLHDFPIRAFGVCVFLDYLRKQSMLIDAQLDTERIRAEVLRDKLREGTEVTEVISEPPPSPDKGFKDYTQTQTPRSGGGVPL